MIGPLYWSLSLIMFTLLCGKELLALFKKPTKKASINNRIWFISYTLFFTILFAKMPQVVVRPTILENSGFQKSEYPLVHEILYEQNTNICLASFCFVFVIFVTGLRAGSIKYQISNFGASIIHAFVLG